MIHLPKVFPGLWPADWDVENRRIYGIGMPTKEAIRSALTRVGAGISGHFKAYWTSLREEPVLYVKGKVHARLNMIVFCSLDYFCGFCLGRPFVLRLFQEPMKNLEITGITNERVEQMEQQMKQDCISELQRFGGRLLLHAEENTSTGFSIIVCY
jgi:hypothetical protein